MNKELELPNQVAWWWIIFDDRGAANCVWVYNGGQGLRIAQGPGQAPEVPSPGRWRKALTPNEEDQLQSEFCTARCLLKRICDGIGQEDSDPDAWMEAGAFLEKYFPKPAAKLKCPHCNDNGIYHHGCPICSRHDMTPNSGHE